MIFDPLGPENYTESPNSCSNYSLLVTSAGRRIYGNGGRAIDNYWLSTLVVIGDTLDANLSISLPLVDEIDKKANSETKLHQGNIGRIIFENSDSEIVPVRTIGICRRIMEKD